MKLSYLLKSSLLAFALVSLSACNDNDKTVANNTQNATQVLKAGVCPGPYRSMIEKFIKPKLESQGYKVEVVEFTDYVQPDAALDSGDIQFNLFQHQSYFDNIVKDQNLKLTSIINIPTLGLGLFSDKYKSLEEIPEGAKAAIPADAVNLARALRIASEVGLITLKTVNNEQKASIADIGENPKHIEFIPMEAAQISRSLDSVDLGFVPGNYAYAAKLDYSKALGVENVRENIKNIIAVRTADKDGLGKKLYDIVASETFVKELEADHDFDSFTRPQWWDKF